MTNTRSYKKPHKTFGNYNLADLVAFGVILLLLASGIYAITCQISLFEFFKVS